MIGDSARRETAGSGRRQSPWNANRTAVAGSSTVTYHLYPIPCRSAETNPNADYSDFARRPVPSSPRSGQTNPNADYSDFGESNRRGSAQPSAATKDVARSREPVARSGTRNREPGTRNRERPRPAALGKPRAGRKDLAGGVSRRKTPPTGKEPRRGDARPDVPSGRR